MTNESHGVSNERLKELLEESDKTHEAEIARQDAESIRINEKQAE